MLDFPILYLLLLCNSQIGKLKINRQTHRKVSGMDKPDRHRTKLTARRARTDGKSHTDKNSQAYRQKDMRDRWTV